MISEIQKQKISICVPTLHRKKLLTKFIKSCVDNCNMKIDFIVVNQNDNKIAVDKDIESIIVDSGNSFIDHYIPERSVGKARSVAFDIALDVGNEFVFAADDDCKIGELSIEKMMAPIYQDDRFWKIGALGGYRAFIRDFKENELRFHLNIGVFWLTKLSVIKKIGNINSTLSAREDIEFDARIWDEGGWTGIVDSKLTHTRNQPLESGERTIPKNYDEEWNAICDEIANNYPNIFKNRGGRLYRQFKFPTNEFWLSENLKLNEKA